MNNDQKLTIISISEMLGIAVKREIKLTRQIGDRWAYTVRGDKKAKEYYLVASDGLLVLPGWGLPLLFPHELSLTFGPKGEFNFITENAAMLRVLLETNINVKFSQHYRIRIRKVTPTGAKWVPLFKEVRA